MCGYFAVDCELTMEIMLLIAMKYFNCLRALFFMCAQFKEQFYSSG